MKMSASGWQFWIDRGGTFTDVIGCDPDGGLHSVKVLSDGGPYYPEAALEGMRRLLVEHGIDEVTSSYISSVRMGTTVATNALLERQGAKVGLVITSGFEDALLIGDQSRPDLFALHIERTPPLYMSRLGVDERINARGEVITKLTPSTQEHIHTTLKRWRDEGVESLAIVLMHSTINPHHEQIIAQIAREIGWTQLYLSHEISPRPRLIPRGLTTLLDAYLTPPLQRYISRLTQRLRGIPLHFMTSAGGLVAASKFSGIQAILSGPAGGVIGAVDIAKSHGFTRCVGFDMGGTSADVFYWDGVYQRSQDSVIGGYRVQVPMLRIHTIASGGGSVISLESGRLKVGPRSAGSSPGPACYGVGGPVTLTDANLILGRLDPAHLPQVFGTSGHEPLSIERAFEALAQLCGSDERDAVMTLAHNAIQIADEQMAQAIREISIAEGHDLRGCALIAFGGAGGQHACGVADVLGISEIVIHPLAGALSAWGVGRAPLLEIAERGCDEPLFHYDDQHQNFRFSELETRARDGLRDTLDGVDLPISSARSLSVGIGYSEAKFELNAAPLEVMRTELRAQYYRRFGYHIPDEAQPRVTRLQVIARAHESHSKIHHDHPASQEHTASHQHTSKGQLDTLSGPLLIPERLGTVYLASDWGAQRLADQALLLTRAEIKTGDHKKCNLTPSLHSRALMTDAAEVELFHNRFMSIAREMGAALQQSAQSVNIRERLDYSCAIFNHEGELIAHAPHIPVHLGSMGAAVKAAQTRWPDLAEGDVVVLNSPQAGGTHLPDVTVISKVGSYAWLAARGHHADIGGITSGSMPAHSQRLIEEGVILDGPLLRGGQLLEHDVRERLASGPYPARHPEQNLNDLRAQLAAVRYGTNALRALAKAEGEVKLQRVMRSVLDQSERLLRAKLSEIQPMMVINSLDQGLRIQVQIKCIYDAQGRPCLSVDFRGTSPATAANRNAPPAIAASALLYVIRLWLGDQVPLNEGVMGAVALHLPPNSLLSPPSNAAVVAGNVETSQAIVDTLLEAFKLQAHSQGTMNNLTLGWSQGSYYETLCGGSGAGPGYHGCDGVQTHMTNSRLTDPEVFEHQLPALIECFRFRTGSGGDGKWRGGEGVERIILALEPLEASILSSRRSTAPRGLEGGLDGAQGQNEIQHVQDETWRLLTGDEVITLLPQDRLRILTPGGGGWGLVDG